MNRLIDGGKWRCNLYVPQRNSLILGSIMMAIMGDMHIMYVVEDGINLSFELCGCCVFSIVTFIK